MKQKAVVLVVAALASLGSGCDKKAARWSGPPQPMVVGVVSASSQRFLAERHKLEIITSESGLQKSWESAVAFCGTIQCEVLSSHITMRTASSAPSGEIYLRVAPDALNRLLGHVQTLGEIAQHTTEREDKTVAVVDTEAKIKNLTAFRDNLRSMLAKPSATVRDLVEIQKQLTETQSELDSETAQRKILANETEKIAVELSFRVERSGAVTGFSQIWIALRESGDVLADSTASLITTVVAVIPWLIIILPAIWLIVRGWKKLKLRRTRTAAPPPAP